MSNTIGTILRAFLVMTILVAGWFIASTSVYAAAVTTVGIPFSWAQAGIVFGALILFRMFFFRSVFAG